MHIPPGRRRGWPLEVLQRHTRNGAAGGLRSLGLNVGDVALYLAELRLQVFCESVAPPVRGATRGKFLRITHRRHSAGEFTAARSLQWRPAPGAVRGCVRFDPHGKNKKARNPLGNPGLWRESLEGARLRATSTRVRLILVLLSEPQAGRNRGKGVPLRMHLECRQVAATTKQDAHERPARCGSMVQ